MAALAVATVPLFTLLFGLLFGHRNSKLEWAGIALGLVGIGLLSLGFEGAFALKVPAALACYWLGQSEVIG